LIKKAKWLIVAVIFNWVQLECVTMPSKWTAEKLYEVIEMKLNFTVLIEQGEDGAYIATVPSLKSCYTQASTMPELLEKVREVILLCLDVENEIPAINKFIGVQQMEVAYEQA